MVDYGEFFEVTNAITGRRVLVNKMAVMSVMEPANTVPNPATHIRLDADVSVAAKESYDEIVEAFMITGEEDFA